MFLQPLLPMKQNEFQNLVRFHLSDIVRSQLYLEPTTHTFRQDVTRARSLNWCPSLHTRPYDSNCCRFLGAKYLAQIAPAIAVRK